MNYNKLTRSGCRSDASRELFHSSHRPTAAQAPLAPKKPLQAPALFLLLAALADDADHLRLHRTHVAGGVAADVLTRAGQARPKGSRLASLLQKALVHTCVAAPTETCRTNRNRPRQRNPPLLDLAVGATQVASFSSRPTAPLPPNRRSAHERAAQGQAAAPSPAPRKQPSNRYRA